MTYPGGQPEPHQPPFQPQQPFEHQPFQPQQPSAQQQPFELQQPFVQQQPFEPQQPFAQQPAGPFPPQPAFGAEPVYGPPTGALPVPPPGAVEQKGTKWALLGGGAFLLFIALIVGGYFAYQQIFVHTPTEVVQAYLAEATKDKPDPAELKRYLCKSEAVKLEKELANSDQDSDSTDSSGNPVLEWHVTGETVSGNTATVYTQFTIRASDSRTSTRNLNLTLVKEGRSWKICGYQQ